MTSQPIFANLPRLAGAMVLAAIAGSAAVSAATSTLVSQRDRQFTVAKINIATTDTVTFRNDDKIKHSVVGISGPATFNLGLFGPGEERAQTFAAKGSYEVRCGIHPQMKLSITVR